jgi:hypothetical protein
MYTAYQQALHDLSVLLTRMPSLVSIGECIGTETMLQPDHVEALCDGTISVGSAHALSRVDSAVARPADALTGRNGYRSRLQNATTLVVDVGEGAPNALGFSLSDGQLIDQGSRPEIATPSTTTRRSRTPLEPFGSATRRRLRRRRRRRSRTACGCTTATAPRWPSLGST